MTARPPAGASPSPAIGRGVFWIAVSASVLTWLMILIGGTVNPTGSSMACPDWAIYPICNGEVFPTLEGGVLYEHGHRLFGWLVGIATTALVLAAWLTKRVDRPTKWLTVFALFLVLVQGGLGGLTVKLNLHPLVSTAHLILSYLFLSLLIYIAWRVHPVGAARVRARDVAGGIPRGLVGTLTLLVLLQVALGAAVRHLGAGAYCLGDAIGCGDAGLWPDLGLAQLHMSHRFFGYIVAIAVAVGAVVARRRAAAAGRPGAARLALAPIALVVVQVALGLLTAAFGKVVVILTFHTAVGGLLLASLFALYIAFGPLGADRRATPPGSSSPRGARDERAAAAEVPA